jgi:hypothetical protein
MLILASAGCLAIASLVWIWRRKGHDVFERGVATAICLFVWLLTTVFVVIPAVKATTGLLADYAVGERTGYLTKISRKGVIWKTWEAQIQVGTGDLAALQQPFEFSIVDEDLVRRLREKLGSRITLTYSQWVLMPYRHGESGYEAKKAVFHQ